MSYSRIAEIQYRPLPLALFLCLFLLAMLPVQAQQGGRSEALASDQPNAGTQLPSTQPNLSAPNQVPPNPFLPTPLSQPDFSDGLSQPQTEPSAATPGSNPTPSTTQNDAFSQEFDRLSQQLANSNFSPQLDRTFAMIGDFFGRGASQASIGNFIGIAAHHPIGAFSDNDLHMITLQTGTNNALFVGGPAGLVPGSFLTPSIPATLLTDEVTDLGLNGVPGTFTAIATTDTVDVFDDLTNPATLTGATVFNVFESFTFALPGPNVADIIGRARIQDNNSALPRDRVFFDYNFFHNVPLTRTGVDVNRFVPGLEKTFLGGLASLEVRVPMAITLANDQIAGRLPETSSYGLGDMMLAPKILLTSNENTAVAMGMGITLPTGDDITVSNTDGNPLLVVNTDSVHLVPYIALLHAPVQSTYFTQLFITLDADTNGNPVNARLDGTGLQEIGIWNDQTLFSVSASLGENVYESKSQRSNLKSLAYTLELHYTDTVNDADSVNSGAFRIGDPSTDLSLLNATVGGHARFKNTTVTIGYSVPLTSNDRLFDGEFRYFMNRFF